MMMIRELLIGCGAERSKRLNIRSAYYTDEQNAHNTWHNLTTLDNNPRHKPDVLWNLNKHPLPFEDETFDEIHAYEVLEHIGRQGNWRSFFVEFSDYWRILKPNGVLCGTVPRFDNQWAWADPSHTRVIAQGTFTFLSQASYNNDIGITNMSDFRHVYKADFELEHCSYPEKAHHIIFMLRAVKPSRWIPEDVT